MKLSTDSNIRALIKPNGGTFEDTGRAITISSANFTCVWEYTPDNKSEVLSSLLANLRVSKGLKP